MASWPALARVRSGWPAGRHWPGCALDGSLTGTGPGALWMKAETPGGAWKHTGIRKTAGGRRLPCFGCDCEGILESLSILPQRQGRSPRAGFSRRRTKRPSVRYQSRKCRMLRDSYIPEPEHPKQGSLLPPASSNPPTKKAARTRLRIPAASNSYIKYFRHPLSYFFFFPAACFAPPCPA